MDFITTSFGNTCTIYMFHIAVANYAVQEVINTYAWISIHYHFEVEYSISNWAWLRSFEYALFLSHFSKIILLSLSSSIRAMWLGQCEWLQSTIYESLKALISLFIPNWYSKHSSQFISWYFRPRKSSWTTVLFSALIPTEIV